MLSDAVVEVEKLSKCYQLYRRPSDRLLQMLISGRAKLYREFWALREVSFTVRRGETVGVVGRNGAGKSTLLQLICGTLNPTSGRVETRGRMAALLELGSGFSPEFTGRENVYLNGALLGFTRGEIDCLFDSIAAFADIGPFLDQPVKTYSSGMAVRLAFAVQAQVSPDVLIVDEALAVGDAKFQVKCFQRLRELKEAGTAILLVSHSTEQIVTHCDRAVLLEGGTAVMTGAPRVIVNKYLDIMFGKEHLADREAAETSEPAIQQREPWIYDGGMSFDVDSFASRPGYNPGEYRWGDGAGTLSDFVLYSAQTDDGPSFPFGAAVTLQAAMRFNSRVVKPILGFAVKTKEGVTIYNTNTELQPIEEFAGAGEPGTRFIATLKFQCRLFPGDYFLSLGLASRQIDGTVIPHDRRYDSIHLQVLSADPGAFTGLVDLGVKVVDIVEARVAAVEAQP
jgi:lipopolysaccharide transport system ATP-binding protein